MLKPNKTLGGVCFKIRRLKLKFLLAVDDEEDEEKIFSVFSEEWCERKAPSFILLGA